MYCILPKRLHVYQSTCTWLKDSKYYVYRKIVRTYAHCHWRPWNTSASIHAFNKLFIASIRFSEPIAHVTCSLVQQLKTNITSHHLFTRSAAQCVCFRESEAATHAHCALQNNRQCIQSNSNDRQLLSSL